MVYFPYFLQLSAPLPISLCPVVDFPQHLAVLCIFNVVDIAVRRFIFHRLWFVHLSGDLPLKWIFRIRNLMRVKSRTINGINAN